MGISLRGLCISPRYNKSYNIESYFAGFLAAVFLAGALRLPFAGPLAARASISATASSAVNVAGSEALGRVRTEEQTSELQSLMRTSTAVFFLKNKKTMIRIN